MICRNCGAQVANVTGVCGNCGVSPLNGNRFCNNCGAQTSPAQEMCIQCGVRLQGPTSNEDAQLIVKALACCFPIVGIILYFVWKDQKPTAAKQVCNWTIAGLVIGIVVWVLFMALGFLGAMLEAGTY